MSKRDKDLVPAEAKYWLEVDPVTFNPKGSACWSYFPGDKPAVGFFIEVQETGLTNEQGSVPNPAPLDSVFYDRKNHCEVRASQLMAINLVESYAAVDDEGFGPGTAVKTLTEKYGEDCLVIATRKVSAYGYKSPKCPDYCNWDFHCNLQDLIFLRLE